MVLIGYVVHLFGDTYRQTVRVAILTEAALSAGGANTQITKIVTVIFSVQGQRVPPSTTGSGTKEMGFVLFML